MNNEPEDQARIDQYRWEVVNTLLTKQADDLRALRRNLLFRHPILCIALGIVLGIVLTTFLSFILYVFLIPFRIA